MSFFSKLLPVTVRKNFKSVWNGLLITDKLLPLEIILAMIVGILLSVYVPSSRTALNTVSVVDVSLPLALGLIIMMIPPLTKVEWESISTIFNKALIKPILFSLLVNWIICPFLMFGLAWLTLFDKPEYREGIIMIGLARCIAMVLVWNEIAQGDQTLCAIIVLINSLLQIVLYAPYQIFFCYVITGDYDSQNQQIQYDKVAQSVAFFLGIPLLVGLTIRLGFIYTIGKSKFEKKVLPWISPWSLICLLYTILIIFMEKGNDFIQDIGSGFRCFAPLILYFFITFFATLYGLRYLTKFNIFTKRNDLPPYMLAKPCCDNIDKWKPGCQANYSEVITQSFTAASNNFELSLAIAISIYGSGSKQSIATTFGPLLEVPILLALTFFARYIKLSWAWSDEKTECMGDIEEIINSEEVSECERKCLVDKADDCCTMKCKKEEVD